MAPAEERVDGLLLLPPLSPARMSMEQGRRRTGCCSWVLNRKPLALVDCFHVNGIVSSSPGLESSSCRHQPLLSQGTGGMKGFGTPGCPVGTGMEDGVCSPGLGAFPVWTQLLLLL